MSGVDFGWQPVGGPGAERTVTVANSGTGPLVIERAEIEGPHSGDFTIVGENFSDVEIWPGCKCTVDVRFDPGGRGVRAAVLLLFGRPPAGVYRVPLTGQAGLAESSGAACEPVLVEQCLPVAVPVELSASGKAGEVSVTCGRRWAVSRMHDSRCETAVFQELTFLVPVTLRVGGECNGEGLSSVVCEFLCTQKMCVELPIRVGADVACTPATCCKVGPP